MGWTDVEAGLLLALVTEFSVDDDEGFRVFGEAAEGEALVKSQGFLGFCHG